jgi:hypothetical protein
MSGGGSSPAPAVVRRAAAMGHKRTVDLRALAGETIQHLQVADTGGTRLKRLHPSAISSRRTSATSPPDQYLHDTAER